MSFGDDLNQFFLWKRETTNWPTGMEEDEKAANQKSLVVYLRVELG